MPEPASAPVGVPATDCTYDADCTQHPYGFCEAGPGPGVSCSYGCTMDAECDPGQICVCGDPVGMCVPASCTSDSDCTPGFMCRSYDQSRGCGETNYACQSAADTCGGDSECRTTSSFGFCSKDDTAKSFGCEPLGCVVGRPFLVEGEHRLAPVQMRSDWCPSVIGRRAERQNDALSPRLVSEWTRIALMEHASIAAFARFTLQLMELGAPPELIEGATEAMADETRHAKACFAIASAHAGKPIGPGRLAIDRSLDANSLRDIVLTTIYEGCVGETLAAVEAREAAEHAADPQLRQVLLAISEDEARHAELAYRFVQWALTLGDAALHREVRGMFDALAKEEPRRPMALDALEDELLRNGIVPEPICRVIRARAISEVILPAAEAMMITRASQGAA